MTTRLVTGAPAVEAAGCFGCASAAMWGQGFRPAADLLLGVFNSGINA
jgi:hypothetical protein